MPTLRVLSVRGDDGVSWSAEALERGDAEAEAAVREAERIFAREVGRGATAFRVRPGAPAERVEELDPRAGDVVLIPPLVGG
jgi:hypothetical protein